MQQGNVMQEPYQGLATEIRKVCLSPWPASLKPLSDVATRCNNADISQWSAANPCLVEPLASCLSEGLQQWPYVLDLVAKFVRNLSIRDALLREEPTLVHDIVSHAIRSGSRRAQYAAASVALLSHPLPDTVALPANVQTLFAQLVDVAAKKPSAASIEPIYLVLKGTGKLLLGILGDDVLSKFEEHMLEILRNAGGPSSQCLSLYCLSIMKTVCSVTDPVFRLTASSFNTSDILASTPSSSRWKSDTMEQLFTGNKAQRSMQLIVLVVMLATRKSSNPEPGNDNINSLVLANEVITAIPADIRHNWCMANSVTIRKLQERLCDRDIEEPIKVLALRFVGKLCDLDALPPLILEKIEASLLDPRDLQIAYSLCLDVCDFELLSDVLMRAPVVALLESSLDYALADTSSPSAAGFHALINTLQDAQLVLQRPKITLSQLSQVRKNPTLEKKLRKAFRQMTKPDDQSDAHFDAGFCEHALQQERSRLLHQICKLLLKANLMTDERNSVDSQNISDTDLLLDLYAATAQRKSKCDHRPIKLSRNQLDDAFNAHDVPTSSVSQDDKIDWREALDAHFRARAGVDQNAVAKLFSRACANLEARCQSVEQPLREEKEMRKALESEFQEFKQAYAELETQNVQSTVQNHALESERDSLATDLEACQESKNVSLRKLDDLENRFQRSQNEMERQIRDLTSAKGILQLDHASLAAKREAEVKDLEEELAESMKSQEAKAKEISRLQSELSTFKSDHENLDRDRNSANARIDELNALVSEKIENLVQMQLELSVLSSRRDEVTEELAKQTNLVCELRQHALANHERIETLEAELEVSRSEREVADQQHAEEQRISGEQHEASSKKLLQLQQDLENQQEHFNAEIKNQSDKIAEQEKKVGRLKRKCDEKDKQIAEANMMRTNLMAAMGISQHGRASLPHRSRPSLAYQTQQTQDEESQSQPTPPTPTSYDGTTETEIPQQSFDFSSDSKNSKGGPTPKRPRKSVIVALPARTRASTGLRNTRASAQSRMSLKRQPLQGISGNGTTSRHSKTPSKINADESMFDGSELFTGTQGARMFDAL